MATNRTPLQRTGLALNHEQEMSLRYGELASHFAFASEEERREVWFYHRDRLLQHCSGGQRPAGWWDYECPIRRPRDRDYEEAALLEAGLLTEDEVTELTSRWRQHFERAQQPGFVFCVGFAKPGDTVATWLEGEAAREAHYRWSGIPKAFVREWTAERPLPGVDASAGTPPETSPASATTTESGTAA
jgi:hypothetical protein